jgi:signal transduction histidine kinase
MSVEARSGLPLRGGRIGFWVALAAFVGDGGLGVAIGQIQPHPPSILIVAVVGVAATAAAVSLLRGREPFLLYAVLASAGITFIGDSNGASHSANPVWFALLLIAGWGGVTRPRRIGLPYWIAVMALFVIQWVWVDPDPAWVAWLAGSTITFLGGLLLRHQLDLVVQLRAAQAGLAEKARAEERNRISRDLHDVIAHTLTVSLLHVMSARQALEHDPDDAARALAEAERLGRDSLAEVRQVVGMLREEGDASRTAPLPGVEGLATLVERFRSAGANVTLSVDGDIGRLPATIGLAVYRIAQEALTNVIKHAPGAPTTARLTVAAREATLDVDSLGAPGNGTGHGVTGMHERAAALGGSCEAGPHRGGWLVRASFPLAAPGGAA